MKDTAFPQHLKRLYTGYTIGFLCFVGIMALLEYWGASAKIIGYGFMIFTISIYAVIGFLSRTMLVSEYYVAGRRVPAIYNGMATAADWLSAASFIALAGGIYQAGYSFMAYIIGWTGGYVLVAVLIAPYLRKFGAYTVPDFLGARYGGNIARAIGVLILFCCSFYYLLGQLAGTGEIAARVLGISFEAAVFVGLISILMCSMLGGMRAVTWTQVAQYIVLIIAYMMPVIFLAVKYTGWPFPQFTYGQILEQISVLEQTKPALAGVRPFIQAPQGASEMINFLALVMCLMLGTAALPHVLMRFFTTPTVKEARKSAGWALFFIFLLYITAPAYAAFAKFEVYQNIIGLDVSTIAAVQALPEWVFIYGGLDRVFVCGTDAAHVAKIVSACAANEVTTLSHQDFSIKSDVVVIAMPEIAGLPYVIAGLVMAGGLAAALSTADGLLLTIANALSHDIYYRMIDPSASTKRRLMISRTLLIFIALAAASLVSKGNLGNILSLVAYAFSLAAAGLFPALVMGVWSVRTNKYGAVAGMIGGFVVTLFYILWTHPNIGGQPLWFTIQAEAAGVFGLPIAFLLTYGISRLTPAPAPELQNFVKTLFVPRGSP
ncbi:MAG: sodium:solute symporter family protein [Alphaproteobacteria bacterium]